jgi:hypothetical protein
MGKKIGSPVVDCKPECSSSGGMHKNCGIKILSIKEQDVQDGEEYKDSAHEIAVKSLKKPLLIRYEVKACSMKVTLTVEYDPGNQIHAKFYKAYDGKGITVPKVALVVKGEVRSPGKYEAKWDGRDQTADHRILLEGTYKMRILGLEDVIHKDKTTIKYMRALAWNHGVNYGKTSSKKAIETARDSQKSLVDGTALWAEASMSSSGYVAWGHYRISAVGAFGGHANAFALAHYTEENQPGKTAVHNWRKETMITTESLSKWGKDLDASNSVALSGQPKDALRDVFLLVLAGCYTGNEVMNVQIALARLSKRLNPGSIDGVHGERTTKALKHWQEWEKVQPADGTRNKATLSALGLHTDLDEGKEVRAVQTKLKNFSTRYDPGKLDGLWGPRTEAAVTHYQEDHSPPLEVTGLPDRPTLQHLGVTDSSGAEGLNVAKDFMQRGCNLVLGFVKNIPFSLTEGWHTAFWDLAAKGYGIDDAAAKARSRCGALASKDMEYRIYARDGVSKNATLQPARYGRDL